MKLKLFVLAFCLVCLSAVSLVTFASTPISKDGYLYTVENETATIVGVENTLSGDVVLPSSLGSYPVVAIGPESFDYQPITSVVVPEGVTQIGYGAFQGSSIESVSLPSSLELIDGHAFDFCKFLSSVTIPENVTYIGGIAFSGCTGIREITLPESVIEIKNSAFGSCTGLAKVTVFGNPTIDQLAFPNQLITFYAQANSSV